MGVVLAGVLIFAGGKLLLESVLFEHQFRENYQPQRVMTAIGGPGEKGVDLFKVRRIVSAKHHAVREPLMETKISFTLNGKARSVTTDPQRSLLEVLREDLRLTGTKYGCGEGQCRACTVLVNGASTASCITSVADVDQQAVTTIEGLADGDKLHPVQAAFLSEGAFQCGYCTAGMVMGVVGALTENPQASESEVMAKMQKHICRCGSYVKYSKAIKRVLAPSGKGHA